MLLVISSSMLHVLQIVGLTSTKLLKMVVMRLEVRNSVWALVGMLVGIYRQWKGGKRMLQ